MSQEHKLSHLCVGFFNIVFAQLLTRSKVKKIKMKKKNQNTVLAPKPQPRTLEPTSPVLRSRNGLSSKHWERMKRASMNKSPKWAEGMGTGRKKLKK